MKISVIAAAASGLFVMAACEAEQGPLEEAGEEMDRIVEDTTGSMNDAQSDLENAADDIGDSIEDAADDLEDAANDATNNQ